MDTSLALILMLVLAVGWYAYSAWRRRKQPRSGFVGRFQRPDGSLVNVLRLPGGQMIATSQPENGAKADYLGTVSLATLSAWRLVSRQVEDEAAGSGASGGAPRRGKSGGRRSARRV